MSDIGQKIRFQALAQNSTLLLFVASFFHLTRNIGPAYILIYAGLSVITLAISIGAVRIGGVKGAFFSFIIFLITYIVSVSLLEAPSYGDPFIGLSRYLFIFPIVLAIIINMSDYSSHLYYKYWLMFVCLSALSLPLQHVIGPISWFSESFERAGMARYGSLAGSLTTFGNVVGAAAFLSVMIPKKKFTTTVLLAILILGSILSLQKAAILSFIAGAATAIWLKRSEVRYWLFVLLFSCLVYAIMFLAEQTDFAISVATLFSTFAGTVDPRLASDVSVSQSIVDRVDDLPMIAMNYHGIDKLVFGVGVFGGSGGLGYPDIPHPHNLIAENFIIFGFIFGSIIFILIAYFLCVAIKVLLFGEKKYRPEAVLAAGVFLNLFLPSALAGALFYHPASGPIVWLSLFILFDLDRYNPTTSF